MAFTNYKSLEETIKAFQIYFQEDDFVKEMPFSVPDYFREDLQIVMKDGAVESSEFAICENIIYPVLKEVWKVYRENFILWSHRYLSFEQDLQGFPEYILARRSPLGRVVFDKPYLLIVEAKKDNFDYAWGQCIAEMVAAQKLNNQDITIHGITSNGLIWQFGKLEGNIFTQNQKYYSLQNLEQLFAVVNFMFDQCTQQLKAFAHT
ncbi:MAG: hypothetical protein Q6L49_11455 [Thermostichales cyanobacterium HHBFW_bins_127]